jgi:hypothetical protein
MRVFMFAGLAIGMTLTGFGDEPSERQMRQAFEAKLGRMVQNAVAHVRETGDEATLARIRDNGTDLFSVKSFNKLRCLPDAEAIGHVCEFMVDLAFANGSLQGRIAARFYDGELAFIDRDETVQRERHASLGMAAPAN